MEKLFESSFLKDYEYIERYYNTKTKQTEISKILLPSEWYTESSRGTYRSILDKNIKLERHQGKAKDGRNNWGFINPIYRNIRDNYWKNQAYNKNPRIFYLDIETRVGTCSTGFPVPDKALEPVSLIQIFDNFLNTMIVVGTKDWTFQDEYKFDYKVQYIKVQNEVELLQTFFKVFKKLNPLIIYAWNGNGFDYPYLYNRLKKLGLDTNMMSAYGKVKLKERTFQNNTLFEIKSDGHYYVDLKDVYQKFVFKPRASYALDFIADAELGKKKVNHSEYPTFDSFYTGNYIIPKNATKEQKKSKVYNYAINGDDKNVKLQSHSDFVYYGCIDAHLITELDKKLNFTSLLLMISEKMGVTIDDALGTVKPWSQYISNKSHFNNQVIPPRKETEEIVSIVGGYVQAPQVGKHEWVLSADVNSMYPLLGMVGFNMSPETFVPKYKLPDQLRDIVLQYFNNEDEAERLELPKEIWNKTTELLKANKMSLGINGAVFTNDSVGMVPEMVQDIYATRKVAKQTMFSYERRKLLIEDILKERNV